MPQAKLIQLDMTEGDDPPREFLIFPRGVMMTSKGAYLLDDSAVELILAAYQQHGMDRLPIDYDHGMLANKPSAESSQAAGWFVPAMRDGGLYATDVQWTPKAMAMLKSREFRHYSPAFDVEAGDDVDAMYQGEMVRARRISRLVNVALTNLPATREQIPLVANQLPRDNTTQQPANEANEKGTKMDLLNMFGLDDEAKLQEHAADLMATVPAARTLSDVREAFVFAKTQAGKAVELAARVAELEAEKESAARDSIIRKLSEEGKAPPAIHGFLQTLSLEQVEAFGEAAAPVVNKEQAIPAARPVALSDEDEQLIRLTGINREAFIAERKREQEARN